MEQQLQTFGETVSIINRSRSFREIFKTSKQDRLADLESRDISAPWMDFNSTFLQDWRTADLINLLWKITSAPLKSTMARFSGQAAQTTSANNQELLDSKSIEIVDSGHLKCWLTFASNWCQPSQQGVSSESWTNSAKFQPGWNWTNLRSLTTLAEVLDWSSPST